MPRGGKAQRDGVGGLGEPGAPPQGSRVRARPGPRSCNFSKIRCTMSKSCAGCRIRGESMGGEQDWMALSGGFHHVSSGRLSYGGRVDSSS